MMHNEFRHISRSVAAAALILISMIVAPFVCAQTDAQYSLYYEAPSVYNPSMIADRDGIKVRVGGRLQWVGIDNAPTSFLATANMPLQLAGKRFGVGVVAQQQSAGLFRDMTVGVQAGYKQKLFKGELSGAVQIGFANQVFKGSDVYIPDDDDYHEATDDAIPNTDLSGNSLDLGVGVSFTHKWFWTGVSCTHINNPTISFADDRGVTGSESSASTAKNYELTLRRTLYFMAGSNIQIKNTLFEVMPSVLVKSDFTFTRFEVNARMRYKKFLTAGIGYRHDDAVSAMIGAEFKGFFIAYNYDYPMTAISKASSGSHELLLGYTVKLNLDKKNNNKHKSIRIM